MNLIYLLVTGEKQKLQLLMQSGKLSSALGFHVGHRGRHSEAVLTKAQLTTEKP